MCAEHWAACTVFWAQAPCWHLGRRNKALNGACHHRTAHHPSCIALQPCTVRERLANKNLLAMLAADTGCCACVGDSRRPKRYFPFAEGPRSCVGQSLAKVSLVATMATLLSRFSFKLAEEVRPS